MSEYVCPHREEFVYWEARSGGGAALNESGWYCGSCYVPLGFRPDLDRSQTNVKVDCLLHALDDYGLAAVSNAAQGDVTCWHVTNLCRRDGVYDQLTILRLLLEHLSYRDLPETHRASWQRRAEEWLREREAVKP